MEDDKVDFKQQTCLYPELYQGEGEWEIYTSETTVNKRLLAMALRLHDIGIQRPN